MPANIYILMTLLPIIWVWQNFAVWGGYLSIVYSMGQLCGLVGIVLLSENFILSGRYLWLEKVFGPLDKVYRVHHKLGRWAYGILALHGILFGIFFWPNLNFLYSSQGVILGVVGFFLLTILLAVTIKRVLPYHIWKKSHQFMSLGLLLGGSHAVLAGSTMTASGFLRYYILIWISLGIISAFLRLIKFSFSRYEYKLTRIDNHNKWVILQLSPAGKKLMYKSGQFVFATFESAGVSNESHPFSLASTGSSKEIMLAIKKLGDFTQQLDRLSKGDRVILEGPFGRFSYSFGLTNKQIWIAGGIGVSPFRGMAEEVARNHNYKVVMFYSVRSTRDALFDQEFKTFKQTANNFNYQLWISQKKGSITADYISSTLGDLNQWEVFICGPRAMISSLTRQFKELGVAERRIHAEDFGLN